MAVFVKGTILHVSDFPGDYGPCDKFVVVLGHTSPAKVLVFTVTSQERYATQPQFKREMVHLPVGTSKALPKDSWVQCFYHPCELRLDRHTIKPVDVLVPDLVEAIRGVIERSDLLNQLEIADCLDILKSDNSKVEDD
jgi:hypothetical protein